MGAWYCEGEGCEETIPGAHPAELGAGEWPDNEPMLCRACTAVAAFEALASAVPIESRVPHWRSAAHAFMGGSRGETGDPLKNTILEQRERIRRAKTFTPSGY